MTGLLLFLARNAQVAAQHVGSASFAAGLAIEPNARHAAVLRVVECDQELVAKSLLNFQRQGRSLMHQLMAYTR